MEGEIKVRFRGFLNDEEVSSLIKAMMSAPLKTFVRVNLVKSTREEAMAKLQSSLDEVSGLVM